MIVPISSNRLLTQRAPLRASIARWTHFVDFMVAAVYSLLDVIRHFTTVRREMAELRATCARSETRVTCEPCPCSRAFPASLARLA